MSLADHAVHAALPVQDLARARSFYGDVVGLRADAEESGGIFFHAGAGTRVLVFPSQGTSAGTHTQAAWQVDDIEAEVATLRGRGVVFEEYDFPSLRTVNGIADVPVGRAAWFKDPDGNVLGLVQFTA